ncbi:hypothetical protein FACS1894189_0060 [Planctomycetales bacterium]|nr:hypothetical protein FACS1894189_0060 [Planctomycetales bacterium]
MNSRWFAFFVPIFAGCISLAFLANILYHRNYKQNAIPTQQSEPQCSHWSIFRSAQLFGVPTEPGDVQRLLPNEPQGHSLAQIVETLNKIGIKAEGFKDDWDSLTKLSFPCIVHLANPDHFIVVSGIEPRQGYVHIFDSDGNRTRQQREAFEKRWTGYTLHLTKNDAFFTTKTDEPTPHAVYDHLILDKGDIPAVGEPTEFVFPIRNNGSSDLIVEDVKVNCGCLRSEKPASPVPPGKSDVIKLFYSVEPKRGVFTQTAAVRTNDPKHPIVVLSACGFTGVDVRIEPSQIRLDRLFADRECVYHCFVRYTGEWNDFTIELESNDISGAKLLRHSCITIDKADLSDLVHKSQTNSKISDEVARNNRLLELVFEPTEKIDEKVSGTIVLKTNVPGYEKFTLNISGTITSPVQAFPSVVDLSDGTEKNIVLVSRTDEPFRIVDIQGKNLECHFVPAEFQQTHQLSFKKNGSDLADSIIVKYQIQNAAEPVTLPITLLSDAH